MVEWSTATIGSCLEQLPIGRISKIQARDYGLSGRYPIVDQGKNLIAGWTDDDSGLISTNLPVVIFGDHTRAFKFVDFPFVRGADGTQVLKPKTGIDPLFFYYACKTVDLPSRGYNRHFKALKDKEIPTPPLGEQRNIACTLRKIDSGISLQDVQLRAVKYAKRTALQTLFAYGLRGETQKETKIDPMPASWEPSTLGTLCHNTYLVDLRSDGDRVIKYVDVSSISRDYLCIEATSQFVLRDAPSRARKRISTGDVLLATVRPTLLRVAVVPEELDNQICSTAFCVLRRDSKRTVQNFIFYVLQRDQFVQRLAEIETGASYPAVTDRMIMEQLVPVPSLVEQREIVTIFDAIDRKIELHRRKRAVLEALLKALLHKFMTGDVSMGELGVEDGMWDQICQDRHGSSVTGGLNG